MKQLTKEQEILDMKLYAVNNTLVMADTKENAVAAYGQWRRDNREDD